MSIFKLAEAAEANLWHDDFEKAAFESARNIAIAAFETAGRNIYLEATAAAFESAGRNIWTEVADQGAAAGSAALRTEPPRVAELLVSSCTKNRYRKALLNDLDEDFQRDLSKGMTVGRARMRYRGSALRSITPQLWALAKRIGIFGLIADYARRLW